MIFSIHTVLKKKKTRKKKKKKEKKKQQLHTNLVAKMQCACKLLETYLFFLFGLILMWDFLHYKFIGWHTHSFWKQLTSSILNRNFLSCFNQVLQKILDTTLAWKDWVLVITFRVFFLGGTGGVPPSSINFANSPPSNTCPRFRTKACPPPAEVGPRKFEKFKYIFVSNLTTFKLKSTLKSCISCWKQQKMA